MKEDASLFKYELAFVIIIKNGAPYMREWIDYHRLAGVDHFYFYDNDSTDNLKEVLQPYIAVGVVDYAKMPGQRPQCAAYNDAVKKYRFDCRYMGFYDDDEFVKPTNPDRSIKDVLHEVLDNLPQAAGLTTNGYSFGSSGHEKADYGTDVIERFKKRGENAYTHPKLIANPRLISFVDNPHYLNFFDGKISVNSKGERNAFINPTDMKFILMPAVVDKISHNHYHFKSREEYLKKIGRGSDVYHMSLQLKIERFDASANLPALNAVFDDGIVRYRDKLRESDTHTHTRGV